MADRIEFAMDNDEKPWMQPNQDITAYFNFGLNERGFKELVRMQIMKRFEMKQKTKIKSVTTKSGSGEPTVQQFTGVASAKSSIAAELFGGKHPQSRTGRCRGMEYSGPLAGSRGEALVRAVRPDAEFEVPRCWRLGRRVSICRARPPSMSYARWSISAWSVDAAQVSSRIGLRWIWWQQRASRHGDGGIGLPVDSR